METAKNATSTKHDEPSVHVGLDVHKETIAVVMAMQREASTYMWVAVCGIVAKFPHIVREDGRSPDRPSWLLAAIRLRGGPLRLCAACAMPVGLATWWR